MDALHTPPTGPTPIPPVPLPLPPPLLPVAEVPERREGETFTEWTDRLIASLDPGPEPEPPPAPRPPALTIPPGVWQAMMVQIGKEALKAGFARDPAATWAWAWTFYRAALEAQERDGGAASARP